MSKTLTSDDRVLGGEGPLLLSFRDGTTGPMNAENIARARREYQQEQEQSKKSDEKK